MFFGFELPILLASPIVFAQDGESFGSAQDNEPVEPQARSFLGFKFHAFSALLLH